MTDCSKHFGEGVYARCWTTDSKFWEVGTRRNEGHIRWLGLDGLKRRVFEFKSRALNSPDLPATLMKEEYEYQGDELEFNCIDDAWKCLAEIEKAVRYVQEKGDPAWMDLSLSIFQKPL